MESWEQFIARIKMYTWAGPELRPKESEMAVKGNKAAQAAGLKKGQEFQFSAPGAGGQQAKYPWQEWLDGELWMLEKGTDFDCEVEMMPLKARTAGRKRYLHVQVSLKDSQGNKLANAVLIKARPMTPEERVKEDAMRVKEKDAMKARKSKKKAEAAAANGDSGEGGEEDEGGDGQE